MVDVNLNDVTFLSHPLMWRPVDEAWSVLHTSSIVVAFVSAHLLTKWVPNLSSLPRQVHVRKISIYKNKVT